MVTVMLMDREFDGMDPDGMDHSQVSIKNMTVTVNNANLFLRSN